MSDAIDAQQFPKGILLAAGGLVTFTMAASALASFANIGATRLDTSTVTNTRDLRFTEQAGGLIAAFDAETGQQIASIPSAGNGFVGVVLKGFARDRSLTGVSADTPFRLKSLADGRSVIEDPSSGRIVTLGAFGGDNLKAFAQLIDKGRAPR